MGTSIVANYLMAGSVRPTGAGCQSHCRMRGFVSVITADRSQIIEAVRWMQPSDSARAALSLSIELDVVTRRIEPSMPTPADGDGGSAARRAE